MANGQTDPYKICSGITQQTLYLDLQDYMANFGVITSEFTTGWREPDLAELGEVRKRFQAAMEEWVRRYGKCRENDHNSGPTPNPKSPNEADSSRSAPDQQKPREAPPSKGANSIGLATGKKQTSGQQAVVGSGTSRSRNSVSTKQAAIKWRACMEPCMAGASDSPSIIGTSYSLSINPTLAFSPLAKKIVLLGQLSTCMASSCGFPFKNVNPIKVAQRFYNSNQSDLEDQFKKAGMAAVVATILATIVAAILTAGAGAGAGALL